MTGCFSFRALAKSGGRSIAVFAVSAFVLGACAKQPSGQAVVTGADGFEVPRAELDQALASVGPVTAGNRNAVQSLVLAQVVDQELFAHEAKREKLDRDVAVVETIEAAKREILARAYAQRLVAALSPPTEAEITTFYTNHPELFSERKILLLDEIAVNGDPAQVAALKKQFSTDGSLPAVQANLARLGATVSIEHVQRAPEELELTAARQFNQLKVGDTAVYRLPGGIRFAIVTGIRPAPLSQAQAESGIRALLQEQARRTLVNKEGERLKAAADLKYAKDFAPSKAAGG